MPQTFTHRLKILFQHCDPAGIVFYPRYFEMVNQTVEAWFDTSLGFSFAEMHMQSGYGVPTASISADFTAPSRMGDVLDWSLVVMRLGRTSAQLDVTARDGDERRLSARLTLVYLQMAEGRPTPWPDDLRAAMSRYLVAETEA
ncbi:thioesterase family protein [uncultured Roseobacter sp.]|uniref:acyl-CoA thioesterase n=1 Tax=uncultured Roseobacter sp. TaxID=114847 RepID=UPI00261C0822|nr:thioesterase family protein [uncultured Roseobacter sp.]